MFNKQVSIGVDREEILGTFALPKTGTPGILFLHGWAGSQKRDMERAQHMAALGCICFTFDMRGHAGTLSRVETVTRGDNLSDVLAAYDVLASHPSVDPAAIAVVGSSYGGYLASILTSLRPVRWLALRAPALYRDQNWDVPKASLDRADLVRYRSSLIPTDENRALRNCRSFQGDVLIISSEKDEIIPSTVIASYRAAFLYAHSITSRVIGGADHALTSAECQRAYDCLLLRWLREMVLGAR
ncbi:alpha/beta fold hydrolase [Phyllobacterium salinisoli]|uniref:Alpha/beta fold hydrolase n=1 Tax=Phyllobacterium salinisoli TaxID=1899321 RepID=A0A368K9G3_9HYPH|nr:alpha/beta fold hydrolase [Phyllobacterium salinisoli]RCS25123.1 alpha/beta fold hydrolase [Phyllobacterium salinisoli]